MRETGKDTICTRRVEFVQIALNPIDWDSELVQVKDNNYLLYD